MQKILDEPDGRKEEGVKKALFGDVLNKQLQENYSKLHRIRDKQVFSKVVSGVLVQKYKHWIPKDSAAIYRRVNKSKPYTSLTVPLKPRTRIPERWKQAVQIFFFKMMVIVVWEPNISHSPPVILVHLQPIFKALPSGIKHVHFLIDGPVTQYCNKTMFYIMALKLSEQISGVEKFTWNYTESGHGKGAPDGVGATCKRTADFVVNAGGDINDIEQLVQSIQERCLGITCIAVDGQDIQAMTNTIEKEAANQRSFKGTITIDPKPKWRADDVFTESESENDVNLAEVPCKALDDEVAGPRGVQQLGYNTGDYVLVGFSAKSCIDMLL
ncbi:hypothetical protein ILUMI_08128 [Ignelater luminosus]|uniref:Uncharacterized protein n=1 Tax=Ignelater luminosus TaxID=2038154 RepID=A0A8K0GDQ1_IGNLU|nr:hypothetical protein ILUMI_08128 [Ignelater luminosus]